MTRHEEALRILDKQIDLLAINLRQDPGLYDEERKRELRRRIEELEKSKLVLVLNRAGAT